MHALCDGGYHKWLTTICGSKHAEESHLKAWSGLCEATRKDVECLFGILKKRFLILSSRFLSSSVDGVNRVVQVCAILHNMLLHEDGIANLGADASHWKRVDEVEASAYGLNLSHINAFVVGRRGRGEEETEVQDGWYVKQDMLARHYAISLSQGGCKL